MSISNQQRDLAYDTASNTQKFLYSSPESGTMLWNIAKKYQLTDSSVYTTFVTTVGDVILNLEKQTSLPSLLTENLGLDFATSIKITADLIDFLSTSVPAEGADLASDIAETQAALEATPKNLPVTSASNQLGGQADLSSAPSIPNPQTPQSAAPPTPPIPPPQPLQPQHQETYRVPPTAPPTLAQSYRAAQLQPEQTYTSTQSAILQENRQPKPTREPRWGDD